VPFGSLEKTCPNSLQACLSSPRITDGPCSGYWTSFSGFSLRRLSDNALTWIVKRRAAAVPRFRSQRRAQPARVLAGIEQLHHAAQGVRWIDAVQKYNPGHIFRLAEAP